MNRNCAYDHMLTGRKFDEYSFLPSPESDIKMEDKYLPTLFFSLGIIVTIILYSVFFVLGNWQMTRCRCCALHDLASSQRSGYRGDTDPSPVVDLSIVTTNDPVRSDIDRNTNTSIYTTDDESTHSSIRNIKAATI